MYLENEEIVNKMKRHFEDNPNVIFSKSNLVDLYHTKLNKEHLSYYNISGNTKGIRKIISLLRERYPDFMLIVSQDGYRLTTNIKEKIKECFEVVEIARNRLKGDLSERARVGLEKRLEIWEAEFNYWDLKRE